MQSTKRFLLAVFLISSILLAYEVLAIRLISVLFYPVAAYLVISLALLGLGVGGVLLALRRAESNLSPDMAARGALAFSLALLIALGFTWSAPQLNSPVLSIVIALSIPFAFGGWAIAIALAMPGTFVNRVYFADLLGAGTGAVAVYFGLIAFSASQILFLLAAAGFLAAALFATNTKVSLIEFSCAILLVLVALFIEMPYGPVPISPKELAQANRLGSSYTWEFQGWNPIARIDVIHIPGGCSELAGAPECKLVTQDGGAPSILLAPPQGDDGTEFIHNTIFGLPYWIKNAPEVLVVGLGGAPDVQAALLADARNITGVEINRQMITIVESTYRAFTGNPYQDPRFTLVVGDGRNYVRQSERQFDVIQLTGVDSSVASLGASPNLTENYLYTVEALNEFYQHLTKDGLLSISFPAVKGLDLKLVATAGEVLRQNRVTNPLDHLVVSKITGYIHVLIKRSPYTRAEVDVIQDHFDYEITSFYFPLYHRIFGEPPADFIADRQILLTPFLNRRSIYRDYFEALQMGQAEAFLAYQAEQVLPATDNRPFFFVMDKWGQNAPNLSALVLTLSILGIAAFILMVIPLLVQNQRGLHLPGAPLLAIYFLCLGIGYILIEVNQIQKLTLLLGHPSLAIVFTLFTLLVASGLGSITSEHWKMQANRKVHLTTIVIALLVGLEAIISGTTMTSLTSLSLFLRLLISFLLVAVPGYLMGVPFPTCLSIVKKQAPAFVAWAWVINSTGSIMATLLGVLLAILWGFQVVFLLASSLYLCAALVFTLYFRADYAPIEKIRSK